MVELSESITNWWEVNGFSTLKFVDFDKLIKFAEVYLSLFLVHILELKFK